MAVISTLNGLIYDALMFLMESKAPKLLFSLVLTLFVTLVITTVGRQIPSSNGKFEFEKNLRVLSKVMDSHRLLRARPTTSQLVVL